MTLSVTFVLFPELTQLDLTAPAQVLSRLPDAAVHYASANEAPVPTDSGFSILPTATFEEPPRVTSFACQADPVLPQR